MMRLRPFLRGRPRKRSSETGMTLPELLISVILMGIVVVPIALALQMAIEIPSNSGGRSLAALQRANLTSQWTEDVGSAWLVIRCIPGTNPCTPRPAEAAQTSACRTVGAAPQDEPLVMFAWQDFSRTGNPFVIAEYRIKYSAYNAAATKVELTRAASGTTSDGTRTVMSGYCSGTETVLTEYDDNPGKDPTEPYYGWRRQQAIFTLRESPFEPPRTVNLEAAARTSCTNGQDLSSTTTTVAMGVGNC
jgi:hypothetical protein